MDNTMQPHSFWEENVQHVKFESANSMEELQRLRDDRTLYTCCDGNLNFSTAPCSEDETDYSNIPYKKNKASRQDPMSHRIIEKRRRDRMNNCLADLSRLIPAEYLKKGRGRIEKTEIIEMAIKYMKHLQQLHTKLSENYSLGYQECMSETMRFLVEVEGRFPREAICVRLLNHLQKHSDVLSQTKVDEPSDTCNDDSVYMSRISSNLNGKKQIDEQKINEESNNNSYHVSDENMNTQCSDFDTFDKQSDTGSASYKYKTNIKLRFSQDLNSAAKRQRNDNNDVYHNNRRTSVTSLENYSSSHSSPPSSGGVENEKIVRAYQKSNKKMLPTRHTSTDVNQLENKMVDHKSNFNVPIFVLHAKGSFYVPLTIDYYTLVPFLQNYNLLDIHTNMQNLILHPVTINVKFQCNNVVKT